MAGFDVFPRAEPWEAGNVGHHGIKRCPRAEGSRPGAVGGMCGWAYFSSYLASFLIEAVIK